MPQGVINMFEVIEVNEDYAERSLRFEFTEISLQGMSIVEHGKRIVQRQQGELLFILLLFGHVDVSADDFYRLSVCISLADPAAIQHPRDTAIFGDHTVKGFIVRCFAGDVIVKRL